jgi:hypothetical protein
MSYPGRCAGSEAAIWVGIASERFAEMGRRPLSDDRGSDQTGAAQLWLQAHAPKLGPWIVTRRVPVAKCSRPDR